MIKRFHCVCVYIRYAHCTLKKMSVYVVVKCVVNGSDVCVMYAAQPSIYIYISFDDVWEGLVL